ncbi:hypothetical protein [Reichenbachiella sp.]|uniref:hypothetical protein n=1 Tax=Reichenbachiella sp. TaxID=2184521 RepID=UPI003B5BEE64
MNSLSRLYFLTIGVLSMLLPNKLLGQVVQSGTIVEIQLQNARMNLEKGEEIEGHFYETDSVCLTKVQFPDDKFIEGVDAKFNLLTNNLELKINGQTLVLKGERLKSFSQNGSSYMLGKYLHNSSLNDSVFYRVIFDGKYQLYAQSQLALQPNNYNEILSVGNKKDRYNKKIEYLLGQRGELIISSYSVKKVFKYLNQELPNKDCIKNISPKSKESALLEVLENCSG